MDADLLQKLDALRATRRVDLPGAAQALAVPEARLLAACTGPDIVRLDDNYKALVEGLVALGPVHLHTDGRLGLHRIEASLTRARASTSTAILQGDTAELRLLLSRWHSAFAVLHSSRIHDVAEVGIHVHDRHGDPVLRIVQGLRTDRRALQRLAAERRATEQRAPLPVQPRPTRRGATPVRAPSRAQLLREWSSVSGTRELFALLRRHGLRRPDAYTLVSPVFAQPMAVSGMRHLLEQAVAAEAPVQLSIGNRACIQIHRGVLESVAPLGHWLTVRDPSLFFHIDLRRAAQAWVVRRPTPSGTHVAVELLGAGGDVLASVRSNRGEDAPEDWRWRRAIERTLRR